MVCKIRYVFVVVFVVCVNVVFLCICGLYLCIIVFVSNVAMWYLICVL